MKKVIKIIPLLSNLLFCFACGGDGPDPGPIDCKDLCFTAVGEYGDALNMGWATNDPKLTEQLEKFIEISIDGRTWRVWDGSPYTTGGIFPMPVGNKFYIRNTNPDKTLSKSIDAYFYFQNYDKGFPNRKWAISGDIRSLINYSDEIPEYSFYRLFAKSSISNVEFNVSDASNLLLPIDKLSDGCYQEMFDGCSDLVKVPLLPATQLAESCYECMFQSCVSLNVYTSENSERTKFFTAPDPLTDPCTSMFYNCGGEKVGEDLKVEPGQSYYYEYQPGPYGQ